MADSQGAAKAAPKLTEQQAAQEVSWLGARLREPSTYAGIGSIAAAAAFFHLIPGGDSTDLVKYITMVGMGVGGLIAILLPEGLNKSSSKTAGPTSAAILALCVGALLGAGGWHSTAFAASRQARHVAQSAPLPQSDPRLLYDTTVPPAPKLTSTVVQQNPLLLLENFATNDLQAALADANAQTPPDTVAASCYQALLNVKSNPAFALPSGQVTGAFTAIQKGRDLKTQLANLASPSGPLASLNAACAAWTQDNLTTLIAVGGAVGLVANPVGATATATGAVAAFNAQVLAFLAALPK